MGRRQPAGSHHGPVRRILPFVALWLAAGALAVVVASAGVSVVDDHLTASRPAPLSAEEVHERVQQAATSTTAAGPTPTTASPPSTTTSVPAPTTTAGGTDDPTTGGTTSPPTTAPTPPVTRTYELVGGTTTIRFSASGVTVLSSTPKPGFTAEVEPEGTGVKVEFESEDHKSRIDAWWANGPQTQSREEARD